jgi:hypothetical protein
VPALGDLTDKAIASTMCGFNKARRLWIIVEGVAELTNGDFEDCVADKRFWPDGVEKFLFGDELGWMPEEIGEQCEGFGSELDCLCASIQALVGQVQIKRIEVYQSFQLHSTNDLTESLREGYDLKYALGPFSALDGGMATQRSLRHPVRFIPKRYRTFTASL